MPETTTEPAVEPGFVPANSAKRFSGEVATDYIDVAAGSSGLEVESRKQVTLNRAQAERMLNLSEVEGDRRLRDRHVETLAQAMLRRTFRYELVTLVSCLCEETGLEYRMNGQHTCWAVIEVDSLPEGQRPDPDKVTHLRYVAKTYEDVRRLYSSIDRGAPRSKSDVVISYLAGVPMFEGLGNTVIRSISQGFAFWMWQELHERTKHDGDDIAYLLKTEYAGVCEKVAAFAKVSQAFSKHKWLMRASVLGAMFDTFSVAVKASTDFWGSTRDGVDMSSVNDPRLRLREALQNATIVGGNRTQTKTPAYSDDAYSWCINAWNAWRRGETIRALRGAVNGVRPKAK